MDAKLSADVGRKAATRLERGAACVSIGAGLIHGGLSPSHLEEWWGYGLFFIFAAVAQILFGLALLTDAINPANMGPKWWEGKRFFLWLGIVGNLAIIALYVVTRTTGIPYFGPEAGEVERVALIDVASKLLEVALVWMLVLLLQRHRTLRTAPGIAPAQAHP